MNLKELSAHLNLSQTTVSRALNGYPDVGESTRRRVKEAARRFNYRPNPNATRLATGKAQAIGHVVATGGSLMIDPHFSEFIAGAGEVYSRKGFDIVLSVSSPDGEEAVYRRYVNSNTVDAVVVHGPKLDDWRIDLLAALGLPFVVHGRAAETDSGYAWLDIDNRGAFEQAARLLTDLGHRRIALVNGVETMTFAAHRNEGYVAALQARGISPDPSLIFSDAMTEENGYRAMCQLLDLKTRPSAVICSSILSASGVIRAVQQAGLTIGRDISIIAHDDGLPFLKAEGLSPPLTTTRSSIRAAGARIAEMLLGMIAAPDAPLPHELWQAELIVRGSTGPAVR